VLIAQSIREKACETMRAARRGAALASSRFIQQQQISKSSFPEEG
jgi:hypothetical protein